MLKVQKFIPGDQYHELFIGANFYNCTQVKICAATNKLSSVQFKAHKAWLSIKVMPNLTLDPTRIFTTFALNYPSSVPAITVWDQTSEPDPKVIACTQWEPILKQLENFLSNLPVLTSSEPQVQKYIRDLNIAFGSSSHEYQNLA